MAPSRGPPSTVNLDESSEVAVKQQSNSALVSAKRNFNYLVSPASAKDHPARFRTRAFLRSLRYVSIFIFWRLVRWAKYIAVGSLVAAISAGALGSVVTGVAWVAAPPTIGASIIAASIWGVGKFGARRLHKRWKQSGRDEGEAAREQHQDQTPLRSEGSYGQDIGPQASPW